MASYIIAGLAAAPGAHAWGTLGHATVAYIAQNYLKDDVVSWAQDVLGDTGDSYLANIASWADEYRATDEGKWSSSLHFIDAEDSPPSSCSVDYERDCGSSGCSVSAIANYTQRVGDGRLSDENTAEALRFLVHFLGDVTQPLHDEAYATGGNDINVTFNGYDDNLHSDWDTYIPQVIAGGGNLSDAQTWAGDLVKEIDSGDYKDKAAGWIDGDDIGDAVKTATRWASDANTFVCSVVMPDGPEELQKGDLFPEYSNSTAPTIELQIAKGGYRLANWLNTIHSSTIASKKRASPAERRSAPNDLSGREFLPAPRELSRAKLARAAMGDGCNCGRHQRR